MMHLNHWYDLSDVGTEELVKESLRCIRFCGFRLEDQIPDHINLCKERNKIIAKKAYENLLKKINQDLEKYQAIFRTGVIVDTNITVSPIAPNIEPTSVVENRKEKVKKQISQRKARIKKETQSRVDT
ncbi:MAG: transposase [Flavobacteriales bacterium Tduv]